MLTYLTFPLFLLSTPALASVILGNPTSGIQLEAGKEVTIEDVLVFGCAADFHTVAVDTTLQTWDSVAVTLPQTSVCGLELAVRWDPNDDVVFVPVAGFDELKVVAGAPFQGIAVDADAQSAELQ